MADKKFKVDAKYNLKLFFEILGKYKLMFIILMLALFVSEFLLIADRYLFKIVIDKGANYVDKTLSLNGFLNIILILLTIYISIIITRSLLKWYRLHLIIKLEYNMIADLKRKFFAHLVYLSHDFHTSHKTGSIISRLIRGGSAVERMMDLIVFNVAPLVLQLIVTGISLLYLDKATALCLAGIVLLFIIYSFIITKKRLIANIKVNSAEDIEKANISDMFINIDSIKHFGKENNIIKKYFKLSQITKEYSIKEANFVRYLDAGQGLIIGFGTILMIYFPLKSFLAGTITLGTLVFIYTVYATIQGPLYGFVYAIKAYYKVMADFESLFQYNKIEQSVKDKIQARDLIIKRGEIEFKNITFKYKNRKIFENFNLKIPANSKIALVGPSGSGKSTLVKLLYRLYDVEKGEILIDGENIKEFKQESLRGELSIVPQECVLFDDTLYNNILFSNSTANRIEVLRAMKFAQLDKIVNKFPDKEETIVGERGVRLSGGEKQRVSIARAILADKKILVLDEATSSLDSELEHEIQKDLENLMEGRTSIIIAHRLSTIMKADIIVVLNEGKIVQIDTHEQLINKPGLYRRLWNLQKGGYIE